MGRIKVQITILCEFGNFYGEILEVSIDQYRNIVELSKNYYETGFEVGLDNVADINNKKMKGFLLQFEELLRKIKKINKPGEGK